MFDKILKRFPLKKVDLFNLKKLLVLTVLTEYLVLIGSLRFTFNGTNADNSGNL